MDEPVYYKRDSTDAALTIGLDEATKKVLPQLEEFIKFRPGPDPARKRSVWREKLNEPLPLKGHGSQSVIDSLNEVVIPNGLRLGAPGFSGFINTMPPVIPALAGYVASITGTQRWFAAPGNFIELLALNWLSEMLEMGSGCGGTFTSGGAVGNLICLAAARQHAGERIGVNPVEVGVHALPKPKVYATASLHDVGLRALCILGMGSSAMVEIPMNDERRADCLELRRIIEEDIQQGCTPVAVIGTAGDVRAGIIDPLDEMREIAHEHGVWFHVDGAYGAFGILDQRVRHLYGDMSKVDSLAVDPHKWLAVPIGCGAAIVRDGALQQRSLVMGRPDFHTFNSLTVNDTRSPFEEYGEGSLYSSIDFSSRSRGMTVWAAIKEIGVEGLTDRIVRHNDCAKRIEELVEMNDRLEMLAKPELSICCFRYIPQESEKGDCDDLNKLNSSILDEIRSRGLCVPSSAIIDDKFAIRPAFIGPNTEVEDAELLVEEVLLVGEKILNKND